MFVTCAAAFLEYCHRFSSPNDMVSFVDHVHKPEIISAGRSARTHELKQNDHHYRHELGRALPKLIACPCIIACPCKLFRLSRSKSIQNHPE
jgi:hypothetical protein